MRSPEAISKRRMAVRLRSLLSAARQRAGSGMQYWQAGGSTRAAAKRAKRP